MCVVAEYNVLKYTSCTLSTLLSHITSQVGEHQALQGCIVHHVLCVTTLLLILRDGKANNSKTQ